MAAPTTTAEVQPSPKPITFPSPAPRQPSGAIISQPPEQVEETPATNPEVEETPPVKKAPHPGDVLRVLIPSRYTLGMLHAGQQAYMDDDAVFSDVGRHDRLPCIRTANEDRYRNGNLAFELNKDANVYVGHDPSIKKKPDWLQQFQRTGDTWSVLVRGSAGSGVINFDVYQRFYPKGTVTLGSNLGKNPFALIRPFIKPPIGKLETGMYMVCVEPQ